MRAAVRKGTYDGGEFACTSPDGKLLNTALVFKADGAVETVVIRSS